MPTDPPRRPLLLLAHLAAFLGGSLLWMVVCSIGLIAVVGLPVAADADAMYRSLGGLGLGSFTILQIAGIGGIAALLALTLPAPDPTASLGTRMRDHFAAGGAPGLQFALAATGALTIWTFPTWTATILTEQMTSWFPQYRSTVEMVPELLRVGTPLDRLAMLVAVVISAPLFEELVFRGYLWSVLRQALPEPAVWLGTSLLFALYHMDPVHVIALLPTALYLGWLRWVSGSVWPPVLAHLCNNGIAAVISIALPEDADLEVGFLLAVVGLAFSVAAAAGATYLARRP